MKFKIESGIPIPSPRGGRSGNGFAGALRALKKGQSVLNGRATRSTIASQASKVLGVGCYTMRSVKGGLRTWRIK
jgi:hypothetical protein